MLARCDAFLTHGGLNSVKKALASGVPMVVVPLSADQPYSAERCGNRELSRRRLIERPYSHGHHE
jgi:UDP:flavonoid glycosyltransferase YjiC (YdhE family)